MPILRDNRGSDGASLMPIFRSGLMPSSFSREITKEDDANRIIPARVSTTRVDSYRTIIVPDGFVMDRFYSNPILNWAHNNTPMCSADPGLPLGVAESVQFAADWVDMDFRFATREENPLADQVYRLYRSKILKGFSIEGDILAVTWAWDGEKALNSMPAHAQRFRSQLVDGSADGVIHSINLYGVAACPVPANPGALARALHEGVIDEAGHRLLMRSTNEPRLVREIQRAERLIVRMEGLADRLDRHLVALEAAPAPPPEIVPGVREFDDLRLRDAANSLCRSVEDLKTTVGGNTHA